MTNVVQFNISLTKKKLRTWNSNKAEVISLRYRRKYVDDKKRINRR